MAFKHRSIDARQGFTLFELAVVLAVLGLVALFATPSIPRPRADADAGAHALARVIERGRMRAAREGRIIALDVSSSAAAVRFFVLDAFDADSLIAEETLTVPQTVRLESGASNGSFRVWLHPLGRANGGPFHLHGRVSRTVAIDPWTGRPEIQMQ